MARPLRILLAGGWYPVTARGNWRESLLYDGRVQQGFRGRVAELSERFGLEVYAFVLMDTHYHLLVRTSEPSLTLPIPCFAAQ